MYWDTMLPFMGEIEPLRNELMEISGQRIPEHVLMSQLQQKLEQKVGSIRLAEDQRLKMGYSYN